MSTRESRPPCLGGRGEGRGRGGGVTSHGQYCDVLNSVVFLFVLFGFFSYFPLRQCLTL